MRRTHGCADVDCPSPTRWSRSSKPPFIWSLRQPREKQPLLFSLPERVPLKYRFFESHRRTLSNDCFIGNLEKLSCSFDIKNRSSILKRWKFHCARPRHP